MEIPLARHQLSVQSPDHKDQRLLLNQASRRKLDMLILQIQFNFPFSLSVLGHFHGNNAEKTEN